LLFSIIFVLTILNVSLGCYCCGIRKKQRMEREADIELQPLKVLEEAAFSVEQAPMMSTNDL
jgi:hypothetical protein